MLRKLTKSKDKTDQKEYIVEKKDKYNCDDYKAIIDHFNDKFLEFLEEVI